MARSADPFTIRRRSAPAATTTTEAHTEEAEPAGRWLGLPRAAEALGVTIAAVSKMAGDGNLQHRGRGKTFRVFVPDQTE